jgi:hypothetical protein
MGYKAENGKLVGRLVKMVLGRTPIFGREWGYKDERENKPIGYQDRKGVIHITDSKTWRECLP